MPLTKCGIPAVSMQGTENDWENLVRKIENLEELLFPIREQLELPYNWWDNIKNISNKLLETYQENPDLIWWHSIIEKTEGFESWGSGGGGRSYMAFDGWFLTDILGLHDIEYLSKINNPLVTVPMKITHPDQKPEEAASIGGIVGYEMDDDDTWPLFLLFTAGHFALSQILATCEGKHF